ncbi:MAG: LysR family transcriptional regulator [Hoeflea sp.]|uniref:LysR family transcriptional regulator n=1 Tax=Hoeflea sp. TaxID=1940281 RepID=UPI003EFABCA8
MSLPKISLQALEAFERVAQSGSVQAAAREMGLSISSVSHHVARLEEQMGATLFDRASRPFVLTREGREALHHLSAGLNHVRRATSETAIGGLLGTRSLRIGIVDDFENNVAPELAVILASRMPRAKFAISMVLSHQAADLVRKGDLDVAIASQTDASGAGIESDLLLRDPFVMALPKGKQSDAAALLAGEGGLPFLRFNRQHLIGKQIEAHLARNRISLADRYAFDSVQSIMAIIAHGGGWSIITPVGFARAQGFSDGVALYPLPIASFARAITLLSRDDFDRPTAQAIAGLFRQSVRRLAVDPVGTAYPWLRDSFGLIAPKD